LLEQKTKALDQAAPLDNWRLADCVHRLRRFMEARMGTAGRREFILDAEPTGAYFGIIQANRQMRPCRRRV
jgi:hypothetical protein